MSEPEVRAPASTETRELRLEGPGLVVTLVVLGLLLVGAFQLGRWVERDADARGLDGPAGESKRPEAAATEAPADLDASSGVFDRVGAGGAAAEPKREAREPSTADPAPVEPAGSNPADAGSRVWVQVAVGRDRGAAEELVRRLEADGFEGRMIAERASGETLYKVRVGPFAAEDAARRTVDALDAKGYRGAWVPPVR